MVKRRNNKSLDYQFSPLPNELFIPPGKKQLQTNREKKITSKGQISSGEENSALWSIYSYQIET